MDSSLGDKAYFGIRTMLRCGELKPGQRISEVEFCDLLGMSRTPVREAFRRLQSEGLLEATPAGRIFVASIDLGRIEEIYVMREAVEGLAARLAAARATTPDLMRMDALLEEQAKGPGNEDEFLTINDRFHFLIYEVSGNRYIAQSAEALLNAASMLRGKTRGRYDFESTSLSDHRAIFEEISNGNTESAEETMRKHIRRGRWQRIRLLQQSEEDEAKKTE